MCVLKMSVDKSVASDSDIRDSRLDFGLIKAVSHFLTIS